MLTGFASAEAATMSGSGTIGDPFIIMTEEDIQSLGSGVYTKEKNYAIGADILMRSAHTPKFDGFTGSIDGRNHVITGLRMYDNQITTKNAGFLISIEDGSVNNIVFECVEIISTAGESVGVVAGRIGAGTISNVHVTSYSDDSYVQGNGNTGGLIGSTGYSAVTIKDCSYDGIIISDIGNAGGIVGTSWFSTKIESCKTNVNLVTTKGAGGISGYNRGTISDCMTTGVVFGTAQAGGIVGVIDSGAISKSFSSVTVSGKMVGGIVGMDYGGIIVSDCFSTGSLTGTNSVAGICGQASGTQIENCYSTSKVYSTSKASGIANGEPIIKDSLALNEFVTGKTVNRIAPPGVTVTNTHSWEYMTNNGTQVPMEGSEISMDDFWNTYNGVELWDTWSDSVWTLNTNDDFLLPVLKTFGDDIAGDMSWFDFMPSEPTVIYKTVGGGSGTGSATIRETDTVTEIKYVEVPVDCDHEKGGYELPVKTFNWWVVISFVLLGIIVAMVFYIRNKKE